MTAKTVQKLAILLGNPALAQHLASIGLDTPRKIKAASDGDLLAVRGIGPATLAEIRAKWPKA